MAEYAVAGRCVRDAARGFSPGSLWLMPGAKSRRRRLFYFMLEAGARPHRQKQKHRKQRIPAGEIFRRHGGMKGFPSMTAKIKPNRRKNGKIQSTSASACFFICISGINGVL
ncbi:MAG: hypothetical protein Q4F18_07560 [Clostridia bacterium]|nr:hypothetical protein [Clostridia bacterium]